MKETRNPTELNRAKAEQANLNIDAYWVTDDEGRKEFDQDKFDQDFRRYTNPIKYPDYHNFPRSENQ